MEATQWRLLLCSAALTAMGAGCWMTQLDGHQEDPFSGISRPEAPPSAHLALCLGRLLGCRCPGLVAGAGRPPRATLPGRSPGSALRPWHAPARGPLASTCPGPGQVGVPGSERAEAGPGAARSRGSNFVFSLCSCYSKAVFSKSLDIAEAHPQFSKEDRYTPCPPAPAPQPPSDVGLVAGLGRRCTPHPPLWPGNLRASRGTAGSGQAEPRRSGAAGEAAGRPRRDGRPTVLPLPWGPRGLQA